MTIKHIVIGGGGPSALLCYGVFKHLNKNKFLDFDNIESFYGTSSGAVLSVILILNISYEVIDDYFIKRPWGKVFNSKINISSNNNLDLINFISNKGIDGKEFLIKIFEPLLSSCNIDIDITLLEFYKLTKKKLYMYGVDLNTHKYLNEVEISYETFPDLKLIDALSITTAVPFVFKPIFYNNMCLVDGGLINNFPINNCLDKSENEEEVLAIKNSSSGNNLQITQDTDIIDYIKTFIAKSNNTLSKKHKQIKNIVLCSNTIISRIDKWYECLYDNELISDLIIEGEERGEEFIKNYEVVDSINSNK
jgi:predicted acylesterase/phospholipase RssA